MTRKQKKQLARIIAAALLLVGAFVTDVLVGARLATWQLLLLYLPAYLTVGFTVLRRAAVNILHGEIFDENLLMALATLGALSLGFLPTGEPEFAEAVFVMIFYQTGELFEHIAVGKSRRSIGKLMQIRPDTARVMRDGAPREVVPDEVAVGEIISVYPGERVPLDGTVTEGRSDLNTAALTGESQPLSVGVGDNVYSGATNGGGSLFIKVTKPYHESTVARILALVEGAAAKKATAEQFITRFARYYTPLVVISALLLALLPPLFSGAFLATFPVWLARALTFLVISCPCALVISVPLTFFGGIGGAARHGILMKGAAHVEKLANASTVVMDKTGTLTEGEFCVTRCVPHGIDTNELLLLAAAAEQQSNHPIAKALIAAVKAPLPTITDTREQAGLGVTATVNGSHVAVGNLALMHSVGATPEALLADSTAIHVAKNGTWCGYIQMSDRIKPTAHAAIDDPRKIGITKTVMLTGDRAHVANAVATALHVDEYRAELMPADKVDAVEALLLAPHKGTVCFVGDGINDAPVLTRADVGIAMGALGADAAIEAADVVLMDDEPQKIALAITLSRKALRIVHQNIVLTLAVKAIALLGSALGLFGAWQMPIAIFADVGVSVLAILNAMRMLK
ncbi:MAG: cadmium-translocating P-type ATPase [Clostridia bacterium]|nr:cadmium-translocating P-type ATPase [Clostridia bacterium]